MADVAEQDAWTEPTPAPSPGRPRARWMASVAALVAVALGAGAGTALAHHVPAESGFGGRRAFPDQSWRSHR